MELPLVLYLFIYLFIYFFLLQNSDPGPEHKSPADYVGNLFDFSEEDDATSSQLRLNRLGGGVGAVLVSNGDHHHRHHHHAGQESSSDGRERMARFLRSSAPDLSAALTSPTAR